MEEILPGLNKIILDEGAGQRVLPYLPLDQLRGRSGSSPPAKGRATGEQGG